MNPPPRPDDDRCDHDNEGRSIDDTLEILQHRYRRDIIEYFRISNGVTAELPDLVAYIMDKREPSVGNDEISSQLHHLHLPCLARAQIIEWDPRSGQVLYHPDDQLETWLERIREITN